MVRDKGETAIASNPEQKTGVSTAWHQMIGRQDSPHGSNLRWRVPRAFSPRLARPVCGRQHCSLGSEHWWIQCPGRQVLSRLIKSHTAGRWEAPLKKTAALEGGDRTGPHSLQGTSMASFPRSQVPSVLGWWGLIDDDLDDKVFLNLCFLESCAVCKQLPGEEPSLPGRLNALLAVQLPLELPHGVRQAGIEPQVLACGEAHFQWEFTAHTRGGLGRLQALLLRVLQQQVHRWGQAIDGQLIAVTQLVIAFTKSSCGKGRVISVVWGGLMSHTECCVPQIPMLRHIWKE